MCGAPQAITDVPTPVVVRYEPAMHPNRTAPPVVASRPSSRDPSPPPLTTRKSLDARLREQALQRDSFVLARASAQNEAAKRALG